MSAAEVRDWLANALPRFDVAISREAGRCFTHGLVCFRATKSGEATRILWVTEQALEVTVQGALRQRLDDSGLKKVLRDDPTIEATVRRRDPIRLGEYLRIAQEGGQYTITRDLNHHVEIRNPTNALISPPENRHLPVSIHRRSDAEWIAEILTLEK